MYTKPDVGGIDLNRALNDLIQAGIRDPNILLKYSQNPPPEYGANGSMLVSLAANAVARDKEASKTLQPSPNKTIAEQVQTKLASASQPQGIAGLNTQPPIAPQDINTSAAPPTPQSIDTGVANLPIDKDMYSDQNYAGGGIVSFAKGNVVNAPKSYPYEYDYEKYYDQPSAALMEVPKIPTADDLKMETQALKSNFVDPNFYGMQEKTLTDQTAEDVAETKKTSQADILFKLAEGFGTTPGGLLRGATAAGIKAGPAVTEMNKNIIAAKRLNRDAINKLSQAKYAESVGDFKTAMALKESAEKDAFEAKKTNATLETQIGVARAKAKGAKGTDIAKLRRDIDKLAVDDFEKTHGVGSFNTLFMKNKAKYLDEFNALRKQHEDYILGGVSADPNKEQTKFNANQPLRTTPGKGPIIKAPNGKSYRQVGPNQYEPLGSEDEEDDNG